MTDTPIVPPDLVQEALAAQTPPPPLPDAALQLIADVAAQSPLVGQWLSGWLSAQRDGALPQVRLVVDAAHLAVVDGV